MNTTSKINNARNNFTDFTKPQFPTAGLVSNPGVLQSMQSSLWTSCCFAVWNPDTLRWYQSSLWLGQMMIRVLELPTKIPKLEIILQAYLTDTTANIKNHEPTTPQVCCCQVALEPPPIFNWYLGMLLHVAVHNILEAHLEDQIDVDNPVMTSKSHFKLNLKRRKYLL